MNKTKSKKERNITNNKEKEIKRQARKKEIKQKQRRHTAGNEQKAMMRKVIANNLKWNNKMSNCQSEMFTERDERVQKKNNARRGRGRKKNASSRLYQKI